MRGKKGIIFAADILEKSTLLRIIREVSPNVEAIKIGNLVLYEHGWRIIKEITKEIELPIIADLKLMDMPAIVKRVSKAAIESGVEGVMICGPVGEDAIAACREVLKDKMIFVFTEFTHHGGLITREMADEYVNIAQSLGCDGVQVPATKRDRIAEVREMVGNDLMIISCGIGTQSYCDIAGGNTEIGTAIAAGADYEIIGRSIYDPKLPIGTTAKEASESAKARILKVLNEQKYC